MMWHIETVITLIAALCLANVPNAWDPSGPHFEVSDSGLRREAADPQGLFEGIDVPMTDSLFKRHIVQSQAVLVHLDWRAATAPGERLGLKLALSETADERKVAGVVSLQ